MDFSFSAEQSMLQDSAQHFVTKGYSFDKYLQMVSSATHHDPGLWQQFAELGWLGLPLPESVGGFGGSAVDTMLVMEKLGAGLVIEPIIVNNLAARLVAELGDASQQTLLEPFIEGQVQFALAQAERNGRYDLAWCETTAQLNGENYQLNGQKTLVINGPNAQHVLVVARTSGAVNARDGLSLFVVPVETAGLKQTTYPMLGGGVACELSLAQVSVPVSACLGTVGTAYAALEQAVDFAIAAQCAEALGAMAALLHKTADYARTRKQFGVPIGSFQVLQHKLVDMFVEVEQARSMVYMVAVKVASSDVSERRKHVSATKAYLAKAAKFVAQEAIQIHGGIGMTEELDIGHYFRRLTAFHSVWGDRDHHLAAMAALA